MSALFRWVALACGMSAVAVFAAEEKKSGAALPPEVQEAFAWYETLGYPNTAKLTWVGVHPANEVQWSDEPPVWVATRAFLLSDDEKRFTVLLPELRRRTYKKEEVTIADAEIQRMRAAGKAPVPPRQVVRWHEESLEKDARALLSLGHRIIAKPEFLEIRKELEKTIGWYRDNHHPPLRSSVFVVAYACHERGLTALAAELAATAAALPPPDSEDPGGSDLRSKMQCDLGYLAIFSAVEAVGGFEHGISWDPSVPRSMPTRLQLLKRFQDFAVRYPASKHVPYSKEVAAMLKTMVAEDEAHPAVSDDELAKLPVDQQVKELIFRLRDQSAWSVPFIDDFEGNKDYYIFDDNFYDKNPKVKRDSPADRLLALGPAASSALIAAMEDKRYTRMVSCWRTSTYSHSIVTVGQCADAILRRMARGDSGKAAK